MKTIIVDVDGNSRIREKLVEAGIPYFHAGQVFLESTQKYIQRIRVVDSEPVRAIVPAACISVDHDVVSRYRIGVFASSTDVADRERISPAGEIG